MDCDFAEFIINIIHIARYFCGCYNSSHIVLQVNNARWGLGDALCDTWIAFDVLCCTASILNLAAISFDRSVDLSHFRTYVRSVKPVSHTDQCQVSSTLNSCPRKSLVETRLEM